MLRRLGKHVNRVETAVRLLRRELHEGEAEAIALAIERHPEVIFLDELEELDRLRSEAGFWIGDEPYWQALKAVAED